MFPLNSVFKAYLSQSVEAQNIMINSSPASAWLTLESDPCSHAIAESSCSTRSLQNIVPCFHLKITCCSPGLGLARWPAARPLLHSAPVCLFVCGSVLHCCTEACVSFFSCELGACFWGYLHTFHWSVQVNAATHSCQWWRLIILRI